MNLTSEPTGNLGKHELEKLWDEEGGKPSAAPLAAAIALAESSGYVNATNQNTNGSTDRGLWQINSVHGALSTYSPRANTRAAIAISNNGTNWEPWTTYKTGAYRTYLGGANANPASPTTKTNATSSSSSNPLIPASPRGSGKALEWLGYILLFTLGAGLAYTGLKHATRHSERPE